MYKSWLLLFTAHLATGASLRIQNITVDSFQTGSGGKYVKEMAKDNNPNTFWHSGFLPIAPLPHWAVLQLDSVRLINGISYLPRQDQFTDGRIGQYKVETSIDGSSFTQASSGEWVNDRSKKYSGFPKIHAQYVRITALTAGDSSNKTVVAGFEVLSAPDLTIDDTINGQWGPMIDFPLVPAGAFLLPSGRILTFSAYKNNNYIEKGKGITHTAIYDPVDESVSHLVVDQTEHDMFCPGISLDADGRAILTGGNNGRKTSIYEPTSRSWKKGAEMNLVRGYQSTTTLSDGRIFSIGGSWTDGVGAWERKDGEIYDPAPTANNWTMLPGCKVEAMLTNDTGKTYRADNHGWLFGWKDGSVFQAGPSKMMNWYYTKGQGSTVSAGIRGSNAVDSMAGNAAMYDAVSGKILAVGGAPQYEGYNATNLAFLITIGEPGTTATTETLQPMRYRRAFSNSVILPDGKVFITGGQETPKTFTDTTAVMVSELWDPVTQTFTEIPEHTVPRTYHSVAILMLDGRVFTGGGGLNGDVLENHEDGQIYSPAYLFDSTGALATRPLITGLESSEIKVGATFEITTDTAVTGFSLIRYGSATHTVNTDQRRIPLTPSASVGTTYTVTIPSEPGIALPGYWMLFALNAAGTPSIGRSIKILI